MQMFLYVTTQKVSLTIQWTIVVVEDRGVSLGGGGNGGSSSTANGSAPGSRTAMFPCILQ